ncbi:DUF3347 domain-containing protein [Aureibaculum sp. A20]|uniref:DUF3347 domain-containing protein n=1 Tax=Aureibaculum flavum TaxID=2795986 RepID=A0ABS0WT95_9FLAO|nr:DUF3347 domain-containing protein [Aureibaculum flavum]MBJ2175215.1 DUF3347 domain-containing protein [Aureibaculum flavum]
MNFSKKNHELRNNNKNVVSKKVKLTIPIMVMVFVCLTVISCKDNKKENSADTMHSEMNHDTEQSVKANFNDEKTASVYQHYIHIKTALVNSNAAEAHSGAKILIENTDNAALKTAVSMIADSDDIETQRKAFSDVTAQIEPLLKEALSSGKIYKQFCPMAFDNTGGYWLSNNNEIQNPYYGKKMLKCGKVTETIEKL